MMTTTCTADICFDIYDCLQGWHLLCVNYAGPSHDTVCFDNKRKPSDEPDSEIASSIQMKLLNEWPHFEVAPKPTQCR